MVNFNSGQNLNLPCSYANTVVEQKNLSPVMLCTTPFHQHKLINLWPTINL